ncbi:MAG: hypothetical protein OEZ01_12450 [Candidatus Heimdallarchaeota archaeon]|nr:hypothetical protein [Candidatus Heimdallarchaeota archaeon]MDH5646816.1 hypothetical protein [Candidatus Heimdallarchaeota archaeon]
MSFKETVKKDFTLMKGEWNKMHPALKSLDLISLAGVLLFGISFLTVSIFDVAQTESNMGFMMYPIFIAGFTQLYRVKLAENKEDKAVLRRNYILQVGLVTLLVILLIIYGIVMKLALPSN